MGMLGRLREFDERVEARVGRRFGWANPEPQSAAAQALWSRLSEEDHAYLIRCTRMGAQVTDPRNALICADLADAILALQWRALGWTVVVAVVLLVAVAVFAGLGPGVAGAGGFLGAAGGQVLATYRVDRARRTNLSRARAADLA